MQYLVTGKEMKLLDRNTSQHFHVPELVLMEQAAMVFVRQLFLIRKERSASCRRVLIVCGSGNNGADGLAIARLLMQRGLSVAVLCAGEAAGMGTSESYLTQKKICEAYGISLLNELPDMGGFDLIVDAIFGIGLSRGVSGALAEVISAMNRADAWRVATDIASGISADTGEVLGTAFVADDTFTFSFGKAGQYLWPGNEYSGHVHVLPMGITEHSFLGKRPHLAVLTEADLSRLPARTAHSNKGTYGRLLVAAGSVGMAGAACLCAKAAYRMGAGLVEVLTPEENRTILQTAVPEAVLTVYGKEGPDEETVAVSVSRADAVVAGPGIGTSAGARRLLKAVLSRAAVPTLIDADGLNILSGEPEWLKKLPASCIVTPHLGEMARLTGEPVEALQRSFLTSAKDFADRYGIVCVLKDFRTTVAAFCGLQYLNLTGNDGMATAGSGDVLSGVIGGLLAQGAGAESAAALGVFIHGAAGDTAAEKTGRRSLMARDLLDGLKDYRPKE